MASIPPTADFLLKFSSTGAVKAQADANAVARSVTGVLGSYQQSQRAFMRTESMMRQLGRTAGVRGFGFGAVGGMISSRLMGGGGDGPSTPLGQTAYNLGAGVTAVATTIGVVGGANALMGRRGTGVALRRAARGVVGSSLQRTGRTMQGIGGRMGRSSTGRALSSAGGRLAGMGGAAAGAKAGLVAGSLAGPVGSVIGTIVGVIAGALIGEGVGRLMGAAGDGVTSAAFGEAMDPGDERFLRMRATVRQRGRDPFLARTRAEEEVQDEDRAQRFGQRVTSVSQWVPGGGLVISRPLGAAATRISRRGGRRRTEEGISQLENRIDQIESDRNQQMSDLMQAFELVVRP